MPAYITVGIVVLIVVVVVILLLLMADTVHEWRERKHENAKSSPDGRHGASGDD
jgi:hypothetical protein